MNENSDKSLKNDDRQIPARARRKKDPSTALTRGDEQAMLARETDAPRTDLGETFKTFEHLLPGGKLRAIAISSEALRQNQQIAPTRNMWPVVEIFDVPNGDLRDATNITIEDPETGHHREVFRHVEILGPCRVVHSPDLPLQGNGRRVAVMVTAAPLRVHVDTDEQMQKTGVNEENDDAPRHVPNTVQEDRSGNVAKRQFGC